MTASQGGSHEQHVKAGEQSHKNTGDSKAGENKGMPRGGTHEQRGNAGKQSSGGTHEQHVKAGEQSRKNS